MKWLGWIVIVPTIYLILMGESEMWVVLILCLLKMPPFDWVGRYEAWLEKKMKVEERGKKLRKWKIAKMGNIGGKKLSKHCQFFYLFVLGHI